MRFFFLLSLLALISCTSETTLQYGVDYRYLQSIPHYTEGRMYVSSTNDTVILKLGNTQDRFIYSNIMAPNGRVYTYQELTYNYIDVANSSLQMTFDISSLPSADFSAPALTQIEFITPINYGYSLRCTDDDTNAFNSNVIYFKKWQHHGKTYNEVYADTSVFYYSMEGELIRFKALGRWYDQP